MYQHTKESMSLALLPLAEEYFDEWVMNQDWLISLVILGVIALGILAVLGAGGPPEDED